MKRCELGGRSHAVGAWNVEAWQGADVRLAEFGVLASFARLANDSSNRAGASC